MPFVEGLAGICFNDDVLDYSDAKIICGFMDKTGKLVIEPKYKKISYFSEGLAAVSEDGLKFGYIDPSGKMIIEQKFASYSPFSEGLAVAALADSDLSKGGYIDKTGKFVIEPKYSFPKNFGDGVAVVGKDANEYCLIDKTGKEIAKIEDSASENSTYNYDSTFNYNFYKLDGEYTFDRYNSMPTFSEGLAIVYHNTYQEKPAGYIKTDGTMEVTFDAKKIGQFRRFSEGFAPVGLEIAQKEELSELLGNDVTSGVYDWVFVDRKGDIKIKINDSFQNARPFAEGLAAIQDRASKSRWGFINKEFQSAVPACFDKVGDFRAGLAFVWIVDYEGICEQYKGKDLKNGYLYIDKTGKPVQPQW